MQSFYTHHTTGRVYWVTNSSFEPPESNEESESVAEPVSTLLSYVFIIIVIFQLFLNQDQLKVVSIEVFVQFTRPILSFYHHSYNRMLSPISYKVLIARMSVFSKKQ